MHKSTTPSHVRIRADDRVCVIYSGDFALVLVLKMDRLPFAGSILAGGAARPRLPGHREGNHRTFWGTCTDHHDATLLLTALLGPNCYL